MEVEVTTEHKDDLELEVLELLLGDHLLLFLVQELYHTVI
jgi:hypothetical protein